MDAQRLGFPLFLGNRNVPQLPAEGELALG